MNRGNAARGGFLREVAPVPFGPIVLCDNDTETPATATPSADNSDKSNNTQQQRHSSWCTNITITDPVILEGDNLGKYTLWNVRFTVANGRVITAKKRYSDFVELHHTLQHRYGDRHVISAIPGKSSLFEDRFSGDFLERRRGGLEYWLSSVVLDRELGFSPEVKHFVLSKR